MKPSSRILLAAAALATAPLSNSFAADYDPPIYVDQAPEYVPVEIGSGWYLRGDLTYSFNDSEHEFDLFPVESQNNRFGGSIGVGYHFNDFLRSEVNLGYVSGDHFDFNGGADYVEADNSVWSAMLNGYIDLGTFMGATPYVGAGVGMLYSRSTAEVVDSSGPSAYSARDRSYAFAYSVGAGVNYQMTQNLSVDVGYQYLASPDAQYFDLDTGDVEEGLEYHQLKVGLRYDLW